MPLITKKILLTLSLFIVLNGCAVVTTAVGVTTTVVGGVIEVVDVVTPDIFDDESDQQDEEVEDK